MVTFSERNDTLAAATPTGISPDSFGTVSFSGEIGDNSNVEPGLDVDLFEVQPGVGSRLVIDIDADVVGSSLDSILRVFDANGNEITSDDDEFASLDPLLIFPVFDSASYFIGVSGYSNFFYDPLVEGSGFSGSTGEYTLEISSVTSPAYEPNDTISTATPTGLSSDNLGTFSFSGTIGDNFNVSPSLDVDLFEVQLDAGDRLLAESSLGSVLRLFNSSGNEVGDDFFDSSIRFIASTSDTYFVGISFSNFDYNPFEEGSGSFGSTGEYSLEVSLDTSPAYEPNDTIPTATPTGLSSDNLGTFSFSGEVGDNFNVEPGLDVDLFEVQIDAGDRLTANLEAEGNETFLEPLLRLFDSSGNDVSFEFSSQIDFTTLSSDSYFVGVSSNSGYDPFTQGSGFFGSTSEYTIEITLDSPPPEPNDTISTAIQTGLSTDNFGTTSFFGTIGDNANVSPALDVDLYEVQLDGGDRLVVEVDGEDFVLATSLRLFNSNGDEVETNTSGFDPLIDFAASISDTYFIGISDITNSGYDPFIEGSGQDDFGSTGGYEIEISVGSAPPPIPAFPSGVSRDLASLVDGTSGFVINGIDAGDSSGSSVSSAGDINGDGIDDLIIGAPGADSNGNYGAGESYVVFGSSGFDANLDLAELNGTNGFVLSGIDTEDFSGSSVSSAGDINGDGIDDLIISAFAAGDLVYGYGYTYNDRRGETYVVFGSNSGFDANLNLAELDGTTGFILEGIDAGDNSGRSVSGAGDINGDGFDDVIIGASDAGNVDPYGYGGRGESYVVFGSSDFDASLALAELDGTNGFVLEGINVYDFLGYSVSGAGDINGDGIDDAIISAPNADYPLSYNNGRGESYVIFGSSSGFDASLSLSDLDGTNGFVIRGVDAFDASGRSVSEAGDINGDGFDDIIIGAPFAGNSDSGYSYKYDQGESYVVFGSSEFGESLDLGELNGTNGFALNGIDTLDRSGRSVSGAGDINGDGFDDIIIGAPDAGNLGSGYYGPFNNDDTRGESYVVFGSSEFAESLDLALLDGINGFVISGIDPLDSLGRAVSGAGDVNGDGFDDIIISAPNAGNLISGYDFSYGDSRGESYVIFGPVSPTGLAGTEENNALLDLEDINLISGGGGNDTIAGLGGDDEIFGGNGDDVLRGDINSRSPGGTDGGNDTLVGGAGSDRLGGKGGSDLLLGGSGDDLLYGDDGDDVLVGGLGNDTLQGDDFSGGDGRDVFILRSGEGIDTIVDFEVGTDFIGLDGFDFRDIFISGSDDASISLQNETLAIVQGVSPEGLDTLSFFPVSG